MTFDTIHYQNIRGLKLAYHIVPSKSICKGIVILLHGFMDHSHTWEDILPSLNPSFIYIAFDFRGQGDSEWSPECVSAYYDHDYIIDTIKFVETMRNRIFNALENEDQKEISLFIDCDEILTTEKRLNLPVFLVGHSFGGMIALFAAEHLKEKVNGVIVLDAPLLKSQNAASFSDLYCSAYKWIIETNTSKRSSTRIFNSEKEAIDRVVNLHFSRNPKIARKLTIRNVKPFGEKFSYKFDFRISIRFTPNSVPLSLGKKICENIKKPILVIAAKNGIYPNDLIDVQKCSERLNRSEFKIVNGGHHCHLEEKNIPEISELFNSFFNKFSAEID